MKINDRGNDMKMHRKVSLKKHDTTKVRETELSQDINMFKSYNLSQQTSDIDSVSLRTGQTNMG